MTVLFADHFNRANGPLGGAWVDVVGTQRILSQYATYNTGQNPWSLNPAAVGYNDHSIRLTLANGASQGYYLRMIVRSDLTGQNQYYLWLQMGNPGYNCNLTLYRVVAGVSVAILTLNQLPDNAIPHSYQFEAVGTRLRVYIDDVLYLQHNDSHILGGSYVGFGVPNTVFHVDDVYVYDAITSSFSVFPTAVPAQSTDTVLTLWGDNTSWTAGTPGSPIFSCFFGAITFQNVQDAVTAVLLYTAPVFECTDVITDPDSGAFAYLTIGPSAPGYPTDSFYPYSKAMMIAAIDPAEWVAILSALLPLLMPGTGGGDANRILAILGDDTQQPSMQDNWLQLVTNMSWLSQWVNGGPAPSETLRAVAEGARSVAEAAYANLLTMRGPGELTLLQVIDALQGLGGTTHLDLLAAIAAIPPADVAAVLEQLAAIRTNQLYTLGSVVADIDAMRTASAWTLGEVIDAVNAVRGSGSPTIADVLTAIANLPPPDVDLTPVLNAIAGVSGQVSTVQTTSNLIKATVDTILSDAVTLLTLGSNIYTFLGTILTDLNIARADILSAISALSGIVSTGVTNIRADIASLRSHLDTLLANIRGHPVWPGLAAVDLGAQQQVDGSTFIAAPMHGLVIVRLTKQQYDGTWGGGGRHYARHWAKAAFETAEGQTEPFQYLGWESSVLVPLQMTVAAGVTLYLEAGCTATVQPWTYKL